MNEAQFQLIWHKLHFNHRSLKTLSGKSVEINSPGQWNFGPGPDFLQGKVRLDGVEFVGSIELHLNPHDWYTHKHHEDERYNQVILHVIPQQVVSQQFVTQTIWGDTIELLCIQVNPQELADLPKPCLVQPLDHQFALEQAQKASMAYLVQSVQNLFNHADSTLGLEASFNQACLLRLFELLGAPYQKDEAINIGKRILQQPFSSIQLHHHIENWGLGMGTHKKMECAIQIAQKTRVLDLPVSLAEFQRFHSQLINVIKSVGIGTFTESTLHRSWILVVCYAWASLLYAQKPMDYFAELWTNKKVALPSSIKSEKVNEVLKAQIEPYVKASYPNFLMDQHKTFCKNFECLRCKLINSKTAS